MLIASESIRGLAMATAALVVVLDAPLAWLIAMAAISSIAGTVSMPAQGTLLPELARDDEELALANSADATIEGIASIAGPAVAAALLVVGGVALAFALNAITFAVVVLVVFRYGTRSHAGSGDDLDRSSEGSASAGTTPATVEAVRMVEVLRRIARPLALDAAVSLMAGALTVLPVAIVVDGLHGDASLVGPLAMASGIGALVGGMGSAAFAARGARTGMAVGIVTASGAVLAMGGGSLPIALGAMAACAGALVLLDTLGRTWVQRITASGGTGKAFGLVNTLAAVWMLIGSVATAVLVPWLGLVPVLAVASAVILAAGLVALVPWPVPTRRVPAAIAAGRA